MAQDPLRGHGNLKNDHEAPAPGVSRPAATIFGPFFEPGTRRRQGSIYMLALRRSGTLMTHTAPPRQPASAPPAAPRRVLVVDGVAGGASCAVRLRRLDAFPGIVPGVYATCLAMRDAGVV